MLSTVAIVDPYFSGGNFPAIAGVKGYEVLWIRSNPTIPLPDPPQLPEHFVRYDGDLAALVERCRALDVRAAFAGCENGVELADHLSEALGLPTNGSALSAARRHKGRMKEAFAAAGVPCARFTSIRSFGAEEALAAMAAAGLSFPVVIKPPSAFSTMGVFTCANRAALARDLASLARIDFSPFGLACDEVLIEEYIDGDEFMINTLGDGGRTAVTDAWRYEKVDFLGRKYIYRLGHLLPPDGDMARAIIPTALAGVAALGIRVGPSHVELKLSQCGPRIIEIGARICGCHVAELARVATGQDIEAAVVDAFLGRPVAIGPRYRCERQATIVFLMTARRGAIRSLLGIEEIERLPSFVQHFLRVQPGGQIEPTVDLLTTPGLIHLAHADRAQLQADAEACHQLFDLEVIP